MLKKLIKRQVDKNFKKKISNKIFHISQKIKQAKETKTQLEQEYEKLQKQQGTISQETQERYEEIITNYQKLEQPLYLLLRYPNLNKLEYRINKIFYQKDCSWIGLEFDAFLAEDPYVDKKDGTKEIFTLDYYSDYLKSYRVEKIRKQDGNIKLDQNGQEMYRCSFPQKVRKAAQEYLPTLKNIIEQEDNFETLNQALNTIEELITNAQYIIQTIQQEIDFNVQQISPSPEEQMDKEMQKYVDLKLQI